VRQSIVALPGTLLDARSLNACLAGLPAQVEVLGASKSLEGEIDRLAERHPGCNWWLGHSLGGIVALQLAARYPELVTGLVLLASNGRAAPAAAKARQAQWSPVKQAGTAALRSLASGQLADQYALAADDPLRASLADQAENIGVVRYSLQLGHAARRAGVLATQPWLDKPMLALSSPADTLCPPLMSDELLTIVRPGVRRRHRQAPCGGHLFPMQCPEWVGAELHDFIHWAHGETA
jgi:pimeloyl-ACP methyl ester carboxylesterase